MKYLLPFLLLSTLSAAPLSLEIVKNTARELDEVLILGQQAQKVPINPITDDATFLRRAYLNIVGRLPAHEEAKWFLDSSAEDKRAELIETLVDSAGLKSRLFNYWADLFRLQTNKDTHGLGWHVWLRDAVETNMPYDQMVSSMLSATGHAADNPAVGYYLRDRGMLLDNVSNTVEIFLGHQVGCAQCHDHPFDSFTQMDYYQLASFLGGTEYRFAGGRKKLRDTLGVDPGKGRSMMKGMTQKERREMRKKFKETRTEARDLASIFRFHNRNALNENSKKQLKLPDDYKYEDGVPGEVIPTHTLFGEKLENTPPEKRREAFAKWVTSPENPYFTKVIANRLWAYVFGEGVVPALDDWSNSPDPLYPELMATLEKVMKATDYDVKEFLRILYHTQLFQREVVAIEPTPGKAFHFSGPVLRRLSAEELRDSFVTLNAGIIDDYTNDTLKTAWENYVSSYEFVMNASADELREINRVSDATEKARRKAQAATAKLRKEAREARENGDTQKARELFRKIRKTRKELGMNGAAMADQSEVAQKARAASMRRLPRTRPSHPETKLRTSELPSPARGNSLAREFGASDRETTSAAHTHASVPQALRLLNGFETAILTARKNQFATKLRQLSSPEERLNYLFLSLYSSYPTMEEKAAFLEEVRTPHGTATFARAMLTSNRFLFVQ